jgi:hypothetical protein
MCDRSGHLFPNLNVSTKGPGGLTLTLQQMLEVRYNSVCVYGENFLMNIASCPEYAQIVVFWAVMLCSPVGGTSVGRNMPPVLFKSKCVGCGRT